MKKYHRLRLGIFILILHTCFSAFSQNLIDSLKVYRDKAKNYLIQKIEADSIPSPEVLILLPWLQEQSHFEIIPIEKLRAILAQKKQEDPAFLLYARFMEPVEKAPDYQSNPDIYTLTCLYWDFDKPNIRPLLKQMSIDARTQKGYELTHLILRWYILKAQKCPYAHVDLISGLYEDWKHELLLTKSPDLLAEMLAIASFPGWEIPESELRRLLKTQNKDGGFPWVKKGENSEPHSTFLAIWALSYAISKQQYSFSFDTPKDKPKTSK